MPSHAASKPIETNKTWRELWTVGSWCYDSRTRAKFGQVLSVEESVITIIRKNGEHIQADGNGLLKHAQHRMLLNTGSHRGNFIYVRT